MKKLLIILIASFSFLFISNVRAYSTTNPTNFTDNDFIIVNTFGLTKEEIKEYTTSFPMGTASQDTIVNSIILLRNYYLENLASTYDYYFISIYSDNGDLTGRSGVYGVWLSVFNEEELASSKNIMANSTLYSQVTSLNFNQLSNSSIKNVFITHNGTSVSKMTNYLIYQGLVRANESSPTSFIKMSRYYETNYSFDVYLSDSNDTYTFSKFTYNDTTYNPGEFLFNTLESNDINIVKSSEPKLQYKNSFVSNENYNVIGKITNEFDLFENDFVTKTKNIKFKLQYGANDFLKENIPIFSRFKIYGKRDEDSQWYDFQEYLNNNDFVSMEILENKFDYSENMLADASITFQLNFSNIEDFDVVCPVYRYFKIEFYFDNLNNGYIYTADNLNNSNWYKTDKFLESYKFYYFPSNYKYAFITSNNEYNKGKIFYPTNAVKNEFINLQGQYYDFKNKIFTMPIYNNTYENDDYYSYLEFEFNDQNNILVLNRAVGRYEYINYYSDSIIDDFKLYTEAGFNITSLLLFQKNFGFTLFPTDYINSELTYFYVPLEYNVYFTNEEDLVINKSDGDITISIKDSNNNFESEITIDKDNNIYNNLNDLNINSNFGDYFKYVYDCLINSDIGRYITLLIIFSFVILIIIAA